MLYLQTNILVDDSGRPRLADFGLSKILDSRAATSATSFTGQGSMRWQAPELMNPDDFKGIRRGTTYDSDVYAFACVCLEVCPRHCMYVAHLDS